MVKRNGRHIGTPMPLSKPNTHRWAPNSEGKVYTRNMLGIHYAIKYVSVRNGFEIVVYTDMGGRGNPQDYGTEKIAEVEHPDLDVALEQAKRYARDYAHQKGYTFMRDY